MNDQELQKFYDSHHDDVITLRFYENETYLKLSDLIKMIKCVRIGEYK